MTGPDLYALACRYARGLDAREPEVLEQIFHPDALVIGQTHQFSGREEIMGIPAHLRRYESTMHLIGNTVIFDADDDSATGETYCVAYHMLPSKGVGRAGDVYAMAIRYQDSLVRYGGGWVFLQRRLVRVWTRTFSVDQPHGAR